LLFVGVGLVVAVSALAQDIRTDRVRFQPGATGAAVEGSITGYEIVDYLLRARQGQSMNVSMTTDNTSNYFNVLQPDETDVALFTGSISGNRFAGILPETGDYRVRVYLMRNAARRNETAHYWLEMNITDGEAQAGAGGSRREPVVAEVPAAPEDGGPRNWEVTGASGTLNLRERPSTTANIIAGYGSGTILDNLGCLRAEGRLWCDVQQLGGGPRGYVAAEFLSPAVSPNGSVATGPDTSALRAGQGDFDAKGQIPCAKYAGQPMRQCDFGVARAGGGYATVVVTRPDGIPRAIFFRNGVPIGADTSEADPGEFSASREADLNFIRIGKERYEIPDAVILGG
jgi:hypothetical protein